MARFGIGVAVGATTEGVTPVGGAPGTAGILNNANPAVKRAMFIWLGAVVVLFAFHVGGARLG